jgi:hypothetical protein
MRSTHIFLLLCCFLTGCTDQLVSSATPTGTLAAETSLVSPTKIPMSPTPVLPDITATTVATPSPQIDVNIKENCVEVVDKLDAIPEGTIVLKMSGYGPLYLYGLKKRQNNYIGMAYYTLNISTDFKYLAYIDSYHRLIITDANHELIKYAPLPATWRGVILWPDQENLLIDKYSDATHYYIPTTSVLFNPYTREQKEYPFDFPNTSIVSLSAGRPDPDWGTFASSMAIYDPTFSRVFYPGFGTGKDYNDYMIILWDLQNKAEISRFYGGGVPVWKRDGADAIMGIYPKIKRYDETGFYVNVKDGLPYIDGMDLFEVSREGQTKRLTYLTTQYVATEERLSLSPDEQQVAFWLSLENNSGSNEQRSELAVLDTTTGKIVNLCIVKEGINYYAPIWSPDGKYLAVTIAPNEKFSGTYLIDLQRYKAMKLSDVPETVEAMRWLQDRSKK